MQRVFYIAPLVADFDITQAFCKYPGVFKLWFYDEVPIFINNTPYIIHFYRGKFFIKRKSIIKLWRDNNISCFIYETMFFIEYDRRHTRISPE